MNKVLSRIEEIERCICAKCYFGALALALTLPDICGQVECPNESRVGVRYVNWFSKFVKPLYFPSGPSAPQNQFDGESCYVLRCAFLHSGNYDLRQQKTSIQIDSFKFHIDILEKQCGVYNSYSSVNGKYIVDLDLYGLCNVITVAAKLYYERSKDKYQFDYFDAIICEDSWPKVSFNIE